MTETRTTTPMARLRGLASWIVLVANLGAALWLVTRFENGRDGEFPRVERRTYSPFPPIAYRWAEPGDTLDKLGLYAASAGLVLATIGWWRTRFLGVTGPWPASWALFAAAAWQASTPWPTPDGWHGLNWRVVLDPAAPPALRIGLLLAASLLIGLMARSLWRGLPLPPRHPRWIALALTLIALRFVPVPIPGPPGYWPRWAFAWGLLILAALAWRRLPAPARPSRWPTWVAPALIVWLALCFGGRWLIWYQRPLDRLRAVVPGKIYLSAMPTYRGLELAHRRHGFRTIINVFNEHGPLRSPRLPEELRFVREHGLNYVGSPGDPLQADAFLDETLRLAQDPTAWPILVHCHGSMDRSPAWMGIYRFLVEGRSMADVLREIEAHRGLRPKASVTLLYNRVLPPRAPERYASDPTARELLEFAHGTLDPFLAELAAARDRANGAAPERVGRLERRGIRRP